MAQKTTTSNLSRGTADVREDLFAGASSRLGYALAHHVLEQGDRVVMGARTVSPMSELAGQYPIETSLSS